MSKNDPRIRPIGERKNLVKLSDFATVHPPVAGFKAWFEDLPDILGSRELKDLVHAWKTAKKEGRMVGVAVGAHVIKVGLSPLLIDLMKRGFIGHFATNGATGIHDYEFALQGETSEDVLENLGDGSFGFWQETFEGVNGLLPEAARKGQGFGEALGEAILSNDLPHKEHSIFAEASRLGIPATIHVAFGCDIVHMDPNLDAAALGTVTHNDFKKLCKSVAALDHGLWLNIGSAVLMPEVFLKAVSLARNLGKLGDEFMTANLDMIRQYRAMANVVERPSKRGIHLTGQHEILLPLIHQALISD